MKHKYYGPCWKCEGRCKIIHQNDITTYYQCEECGEQIATPVDNQLLELQIISGD